MDFGVWERLYGRSLSNEEKSEIKHRLLGLIDLVEEVHDSKPDYFNGFLDGIKRGREECERATTPPSPT